MNLIKKTKESVRILLAVKIYVWVTCFKIKIHGYLLGYILPPQLSLQVMLSGKDRKKTVKTTERHIIC